MKKCITIFTIYLVLIILITGTLTIIKKSNDNKSASNSSEITNVSDSNEGNDPSGKFNFDDLIDSDKNKDKNNDAGNNTNANIIPCYTFDSSKPSDIYGTYSQDDLKVTYVNETINGVSIDIPHIEGLKNKDIEDKIQNEINDTIKKLMDGGENPVYGYCNVYSTFGNTISIMCNATYNSTKNEYNSVSKCLNYNLVTGEKIYLSDLFVDDCNMALIYYNALYDSAVVNNYYEDQEAFYNEHPDYDEYFDEENYVGHADEETIIREVNKYLSLPSSSINFVFTEEYVLIYDYRSINTCYTLRYDKIKDLVNIYNKYEVADNIYLDDFKDVGQDGVFNFTAYRPYDKCEMYGFIEDNVFVDFTSIDRGTEFYGVEKDIDNSYNKIYDEHIKKEYDYINDVIDKAKNDKDHIYLIFSSFESDIATESFYDSNIDEWSYDLTNLMNIRSYRNTYVIPKDEYEVAKNKDNMPYRDILINAYKEHMAFAFDKRLEYIYDDDWNLMPEPYSTVEESNHVYLYDMDEEISDVSQLFNVPDYMTEIYYAILNDEAYDNLGYLDLESELLNASEITFDAYGISITLLNHPEYYINLSYTQFDPNVLRVYLLH